MKINQLATENTMKRQIKKTVLATVILIILVISQTVSAAPLHPMSSGPVSQFMYDNFDDNGTDLSLWSIEQVGGPTAAETNQRLQITVPANSSEAEFSAWYLSACQLRGDFDIQVDYELLTWPLANGVRISLTNDYANVERTSFGPAGDFAGGPEVYLTDFAGNIVGITPTSDRSGKLRLARVGETLTGFYFGNGGWITVGSNSDPAYTADTGFYLGAWSHDPIFADQEVKLAFDNLMINQGELICPQTPAPDLAITQVADPETVSTGDPVGFTIKTTNNGDATANSVTLSDTLPTAAELNWSVSGTDAAACTITAGALSCNFGDMSPGAVKTIRLTSPTRYIVGEGFCQSIGSTATVMATNQPEGRSATASTAVLCPSVFIELLADNQDSQSIPAGDPVSFTVTFGNTGEGIARDVIAVAQLPDNPGLSWSISSSIPAEAANNCVFVTDAQGSIYEVSCSFDQMTPGQQVAITLASPTTYESCGWIRSGGYISISNGVWDRSAMKPPIITCPPPDLTITQVADHATVSTGDPVGFMITATNNGDGIANGVTLSDTLSTAAELNWSVSGTDGASCTITAGVVSCDFGDMSPGAVKSIRLTSPTQFLWGQGFCPVISSTATVTATNQPEGRSATASTTVLCPSVYIDVWPDAPSVLAGDPVSFTVTVGNTGEGIARDVDTYVGLPTNLGLSWSITNVTPASVADKCSIRTDGAYLYLSCLFDQMAPLDEILITVTSPTTYDSCGTLRAGGSVAPSNGGAIKGKPVYITVTCPVTDTTPPVITLTALPEGAVYRLGQTVNADYACQDEADGSGLASCIGTVPNGSPIDTSSIGEKIFTVAATDNTGNTVSVRHSYRVLYNFTGFSSPVDNPSILNTAKAGQSIPLKWRITDVNGNPVTNLSGVSVIAVSLSCSSAPTTDAIEEYANSSSGLQNLGDGYYQWNWKSPTSYANSCKTLKLDLGEGVGFEHLALFQFKK